MSPTPSSADVQQLLNNSLDGRQTDRQNDVIVTRLKVINDMLTENGKGVDETGQIIVPTDL